MRLPALPALLENRSGDSSLATSEDQSSWETMDAKLNPQ